MAKVAAKDISTEGKTVEELQSIINDLKDRNLKLEAEKAELFKKSQQIKEVEKIVEKIIEVPVERIVEVPVEKIVEIKVSKESVNKKFKVGDKVYYPEKYQRMAFEVKAISGIATNGEALYRIFNHDREIEIDLIPENKIKKL